MNRWLRIAIVMAVPVVLAVVMARPTARPGQPNPVDVAVYNYLRDRDAVSDQTRTVQHIAQAAQPGYFTSDMSRATFGSSVYFLTTHRYAARGVSAIATPWPGELSAVDKNLRPLPFPAAAVWCVLLGPPDQAVHSVVFVALHQDDYKADWIVHEPMAETVDELQANLSRVGCELAVEARYARRP